MTDHQLKDSHLLKDSGKGPRTAPAEVPNSLANNSVSVKLHLLNCIAFMLQKNRLWFYLREPQIACKKELWHARTGWGGEWGNLETPPPLQVTAAWGSKSIWTFSFPLERMLCGCWRPLAAHLDAALGLCITTKLSNVSAWQLHLNLSWHFNYGPVYKHKYTGSPPLFWRLGA